MDNYTILKDIVLPLMGILATPIAFYLGFTKGTGKTIDIALEKVEAKMKKSPTAQRLLKVLEMSDKLFGDAQTIEQITGFFKEARELVSGPEAKNFFTNVSELMKQLGEKTEPEVDIKLPTLPGASDDKGGDVSG